MKIINLSEKQFKNYSKLHCSRNYFQTVEYADVKNDYNYWSKIDKTELNGTRTLGAEVIYRPMLLIKETLFGIHLSSDKPGISKNSLNVLDTSFKISAISTPPLFI